MARLKHIALRTQDPAKAAEFFKRVFGLKELRRTPPDSGAHSVNLTDGYIYFTIGNLSSPGPSTISGVDHIGFYVDDLQETCDAMEAAGACERADGSRVNRRYDFPSEGLSFDLRVQGWDEQIKERTQLYVLTPAVQEPAGETRAPAARCDNPEGFTRVTNLDNLPPGHMASVQVDDERILLVNLGGTCYAVRDKCPHADGRLSEGVLEDNLVECPLHGSQFDVISGKVLTRPAKENLTCYKVRVEGDNILVGPPTDRPGRPE